MIGFRVSYFRLAKLAIALGITLWYTWYQHRNDPPQPPPTECEVAVERHDYEAQLTLCDPALHPEKYARDINIALISLLHHADMYRNLGRSDEAAASYQQVLAIDPKQIGAWQGLWLVHERQGNLTVAIADLTKLVELQPGDPGHLRLRGRLYCKAGQVDLANADLTEVSRREPERPESCP
jgi:tetratricopeptide (TPR) repeat protein